MTFIDAVLKYSRETESPRKYWYWSALAAIAGVTKSNVFLDKFKYKLYPNIFLLLVGRSGLRKGLPINLARALVEEINNTRVYAGRVSLEGVIFNLAKSITKEQGGPPVTDAACMLIASEFASFIVENKQALTTLTDLYDGHYYEKAWSYMLKNSPVDKLTKPCVTFFSASNETNLKEALPDSAISGGFLARTFVIYADKKSNKNSLTDAPKETIQQGDLVNMLRPISRLKGEFKWSDGGKKLYNDWYDRYEDESVEEDATGTLERLHEHILKAAMLISMSRKRDLILEKEDMEEAIRACMDFVPGSKRVSIHQVGKSVSAPGTAVLLRELITNPAHEITRKEALSKHWAHFDFAELDRIAESLAIQKAIIIRPVRGEKGEVDQLYVASPKLLEKFRQGE